MDYSKTLTPKSELDARIEKLQRGLRENQIDAALILQSTDLFYFSGTVQQAYLYVPADGQPVLMVKKDVERACRESALDNIVAVASRKEIPANIGKKPSLLGLELDVLSVNVYNGIKDVFDSVATTDISHLIRMIRAVKSDYELDRIRVAAELSDQLVAFVPEVLTEEMAENEFAGLVEAEARRLGHQGLVRMRLWGAELFYGHIMAGASAAAPSCLSSPTGGQGINPAFPQGASWAKIKPQAPVLVDMAFAFNGYLADQTRVYAIGGLPDDLMAAHEAMRDVQDLVRKEARAGVAAGTVYDLALACAEDLGYADNFMGADDQRVRFVGHGVGLELDEYPFLAKGQRLVLETGMVVAVEPKLVFPGKGVVGPENTHIVRPDGLEPLGNYPETVTIV